MLEIIIIVGIVGIIAIIYFLGTRGGGKLIAERNARIERAESGIAKIISSAPAGLSSTWIGHEYQVYEFNMEVSSKYKEVYRAKSVWEVYPMGGEKVHIGMEVNVKIDADDQQTIYPMVDGLKFSWNYQMLSRKNKM